MLNAKIPVADTLPENPIGNKPAKPSLEAYIRNILATLKDPKWKLPQAPGSQDDEEAAKAMHANTTQAMCDGFLERLIEEDKPENGIEEDYKAKKNKVLMWQSRRLFCQHHLRVYAQKEVGSKPDFMDIVRIVKGIPPLVATPAAIGDDPNKKAEQQETEPAGDGGAS